MKLWLLAATCSVASGTVAPEVQAQNALQAPAVDLQVTSAESKGYAAAATAPVTDAEAKRAVKIVDVVTMKLDEDPALCLRKYEELTAGSGVYTRWLYWLAIIWLIWATLVVCDEFFVPSIEAFTDRNGIPEDVAGCTIMAMGCNGPEMFTNIASLFLVKSDVGTPALIGSLVFKETFILGCSIIVSPHNPVEVEFWPFVRDCVWYMIAIFLVLFAYEVGGYDMTNWWTSLVVALGFPLHGVCAWYTKDFVAWWRAKYGAIVETEGYHPAPDDGEEHLIGFPTPKSFWDYLIFPVRILNYLTMHWCDVRESGKEKYWFPEFWLSVAWLCFWSAILTEACNRAGYAFNISQSLLGLTLIAIGTTFPNILASVIVARKGRTAMAIGNALGSNIQACVSALGLPWFCYNLVYGDLILPEIEIVRRTTEMVIVHILCLLLWYSAGLKFLYWHAWAMFVMYLVYLTYALMHNSVMRGFDTSILDGWAPGDALKDAPAYPTKEL